MRQAKFNDGWRKTQDLSNYNCQLRQVLINDAQGVSDKFCLELNNGISVLCGKNGVGKSTILKTIYSYVNKIEPLNNRLDFSDISISIMKSNLEAVHIDNAIVNYLEPSVECSKIISFLNDSDNIYDFIEGIEPNGLLGKKENVEIIGNIIGRVYSKIEVYEVEGALKDDYTFPFIKVTLPDGLEYTCIEMGAGEYLCMYIFWYINWIERNSILLIDEIENCISVYSQEYLMDYLAHISTRRGIWILLSSHSETILSKVGIRNARLISNISSVGISVVSPKHERKYFTALGIKPRKKGVFIVEDKFSYMFLKCILNRAASDIAYDYHIVSFQDGESDIEKVVKHFNPNKKVNFNLLAVFDADMHEKIGKLIGKEIPVASLPSTHGLNPEQELWNILSNNIEQVALLLGSQYDDVLHYHEQCDSLDHHDRFMQLSEYLNVNEETLFNSIFTLWHSENRILVNKFVFYIYKSTYDLTVDEINLLAKEMALEELQVNMHFDKRMLFDGKDLLFIG
ncbi:ATP-dependent nuclease [Enterobacter wuhouensis]|uniref:ATP-dependent nuclease n=1 Tax=Enterobacter wuhouensis TaxID=2529381 RepID=UPI003526B338